MPNQETLSNRPGRQKIRFGQNLDGPESEKQSGGEETLGTGIRRGRRVVRRRVMRLGEEYLTVDKKEKKEKTVSRGQEAKEKGGVAGLRKPRFKLELPEPPKPKSEIKGFQLSIGFFLKFLIIAGIIIAIFFFLGSQILQIKKSWQK